MQSSIPFISGRSRSSRSRSGARRRTARMACDRRRSFDAPRRAGRRGRRAMARADVTSSSTMSTAVPRRRPPEPRPHGAQLPEHGLRPRRAIVGVGRHHLDDEIPSGPGRRGRARTGGGGRQVFARYSPNGSAPRTAPRPSGARGRARRGRRRRRGWPRPGDVAKSASGAMYCTDPATSFPARSTCGSTSPKSMRTTRPAAASITLLGLTSRWASPARWTAGSASAMATSRSSASTSEPLAERAALLDQRSSPRPWTRSSTRKATPRCVPMVCTATTPG